MGVQDLTLSMVLIVAVGVFLASFMDAIAGGGGIISVPVYLMAFSGLPTYYVLGTNKLSAGIGTIFSTGAKGVRYLELAEGYILSVALDENNEAIGYKFVRVGKMLESIRHGMDPKEAYEKNIGTYGRYENAAKYIDPREE